MEYTKIQKREKEDDQEKSRKKGMGFVSREKTKNKMKINPHRMIYYERIGWVDPRIRIDNPTRILTPNQLINPAMIEINVQ